MNNKIVTGHLEGLFWVKKNLYVDLTTFCKVDVWAYVKDYYLKKNGTF